MASEEEEQLQRLDDVTLSGSQSTEGGKTLVKHFQWYQMTKTENESINKRTISDKRIIDR